MKRKMKLPSNNNGILKHLVITALAGVGFWLIGELLFPALTEKIWTPLGIALYFLIFAALMSIVLFAFLASKADVSTKENKRNIKEGYAIGAIIMAALVLFSCLFEFLYELGGHDSYEPTSYVFLVDDSGSMAGTEDIRVQAIKEVMENNDSDKPYAVYKFSDSAELIKPMSLYRDTDAQSLEFYSSGGTEILGSIKAIVNDFKNGALNGAGNSPKILLVSDGGSSRLGSKSVARLCKKNNISVSTIGVEGCDRSFLTQIADSTGGVFVSCNDVSKLSESLEQAKAMNTERNLLSTRFIYQNDGLYAFLRILFLGLLGIAWSFAKMYLCHDSKDILKKTLIFSIACCTAATLLLEFLSGTFVSIRLLRLIFCVLWAVTYGQIFPKKKGPGAKYGEATGLEGAFGSGTDREKDKHIHSGEDATGSTKTLMFDSNEGAVQTGTTPIQSPFGNGVPTGVANTHNPFDKSGSNSSGSFSQSPFGGQSSSSSPFGSSGSSPFGNNNSSSNPFGNNNSSSNPFS